MDVSLLPRLSGCLPPSTSTLALHSVVGGDKGGSRDVADPSSPLAAARGGSFMWSLVTWGLFLVL